MYKGLFLKIFFVTGIIIAGWDCSSACTVCHSKNPKMVRMHEALEFKDCFTCHAKGLKSSPEEKKVQMSTDERCIRCHAGKDRR